MAQAQAKYYTFEVRTTTGRIVPRKVHSSGDMDRARELVVEAYGVNFDDVLSCLKVEEDLNGTTARQ